MSCVGCSRDGWTPEEKRRWTINISYLIADPRGREAFHKFLCDRSLIKAHLALKFWEDIDNTVQKSFKKDSDLDIKGSLGYLHSFAVDNVNLDWVEIEKLKHCYDDEDVTNVEIVLEQIKQSVVVNQLRDYYINFCKEELK